ncbi:family S53 protease [Mycena albidolilacea]|uniref:Family S53 protease n=1 Tax=Mycena albidolilacea TaxID=1033008 RepID=A0AAD6ZAQ7_9AGAR|nr:family S53 protease [Mycena albidolilacea]
MLKYLVLLSPLLVGARGDFVLVERRDSPPPGFSRIGSAPANDVLNLRLALAQGNIEGLHDTVYEISTPGSSRYGQYLTAAEVAQYVSPSAETLSQVNSWLAASDLTASPLTPAGDWISVNMTITQANSLLAADFATFQNEDTNQTVVRTLSYSIPSALKTSVDWVHPTTGFPTASGGGFPTFINKTSGAPVPKAPRAVPDDCRGDTWTLPCILQLYGISSTPAKPAANLFGVSGFGNDFANKRDLKTFLQTYRPDMNPNTTFDLLSVDDGINNQLPAGAGIGGNPDIQWSVGLTSGVPVTFISTGTLPNDLVTEMLDQAHYLLSMDKPPQTILNTDLPGLESQVASPQMAVSLCNAYAQLAARGVSYITQTSIWGAGSVPLPGCQAFDPPFPASCPFVTAVGATEFTTDETEETASTFSGGGFSKFFKRPPYQDAAVEAYLKASNNTHTTAFNASGRALPDVAAMIGVDWIFAGEVIDFLTTPEYSATIFASVVALLTNERIAAGRPGLGFLNPLIYKYGNEAFNDFQTGGSWACAGALPGFNSTKGWDPVTGFGSPSYPKLLEICSKL